MPKVKQKEKTHVNKPSDLRFKKNMQITLLAVLLAIGANALVWSQLLKPHNQKVFDAAVATAADHHQQVVESFVADMQMHLVSAARQIAQIKAQRQEASWVFFEDEGFDFKPLLDKQAEHTVEIQLYPVETLRSGRIHEHALSFIDIDMLNKAVKNINTFPEAVQQADSGQWRLHWAIPIVGLDAPTNVDAVLLVKTSVAGLQTVLTQGSNALLKIDLVQNIGRSGQRVFLSVGNGAQQGAQSREIAETFWQINVLPSAAFKSQNFHFPLWIMGLVLVIVLLCVGLVVWLFVRPAKVEVVDADTLLLREKYRKSTSQEDELASETEENPTEAQNPFDFSSTPSEAKLDESQVAVNESYAVPGAIFRAYDIRGVVGEELSFELAHLIGQSIASEVLAAGDKTMLVGFDARTHSPELAHHLQQGIISTGCDVIDIGLVPTPLLNFAAIFSDKTGSGVIVTASHNPKNYNGFKIIIDEKSLQENDLQAIKQRILSASFARADVPGQITQADFEEDYIDTVLADIAVGPEMKVVVDAANGASSELAPALFNDLGCEVVPLFCEFNGDFPNHNPDPCDENNLQALIKKVIEENATLGVALDGDGDRLVVVTPKGHIIWPDQLLMIFVKDVVARNPGCDVVFDVKSTRHLSQLIASYGGRPVMCKTGHAHIKSKMIETNALLAGEFSGHIFFKERWFGFDDGLYAAARLLEILSLSDDSLDDLLSDIPKSVSTGEIKIAVDDSEKQLLVERLINESYFEKGEKTLIDGMRVDFAKGWGLVRASNTSAALTLRFEGDTDEVVYKLKEIFKREIAKVDPQLQLDF